MPISISSLFPYFSAFGVDATVRHFCHTGVTFGILWEALAQTDGLRNAREQIFRDSERNDIVGVLPHLTRDPHSLRSGEASKYLGIGQRRHRSPTSDLARTGLGRHVPARSVNLMPSIVTFSPSTIMNAQATRVLARRQLLVEGTRGVSRGGYRCFSCTARSGQGQQQTPAPRKDPRDPAGTTHFGFETVAEALKEQKGMWYPSNKDE